MSDMPDDELTPDARAAQKQAWLRMTPGEKIRVVDRLWQQARVFKRATLKSLHPDWDDERIDEALWEAMSGRRRDSL